MEIRAHAGDHRHGWMQYTLEPARRKRSGGYYAEDVKRLNELLPRIQAMAQKQLGLYFKEVESLGSMLVVHVKVGTSSGPLKFKLRSFLGWVELCDAERV